MILADVQLYDTDQQPYAWFTMPMLLAILAVLALFVATLIACVLLMSARINRLEDMRADVDELTTFAVDAHQWMTAADGKLGEETRPQERVIVEHWAAGMGEPQRPSPTPRPETVKRRLGDRTFEFRAPVTPDGS